MEKTELIKWWKKEYKGKKDKTYEDITTKPSAEWDVTLLWAAIVRCKKLTCEPKKEDALNNLKDERNNLAHKRPLQIRKMEYDRMAGVLKESYTQLLGSEAQPFNKRLDKIAESESTLITSIVHGCGNVIFE